MMRGLSVLAHGGSGVGSGGSSVANWTPLLIVCGIYLAVAVALAVAGPARGHHTTIGRFALRIPNALERLTGLPGWAAATALTSMAGLLLAGIGFYSDVAYHIAYGRDESVFTAPHIAILIGLVMLLAAAIVAVVTATLTKAPVGVRWGRLHVPWSALPLGVIGIGAVAGFPIDELWHRQYGIDVTMWSPPHLMMILGAALSGLASWLVVAESGASPRDSRWARGFHVVAAWLTLLGLIAPAGEFYFGVPQWQQLYHPVLVMLAAGVCFVAMRIVLGRGWALGIAVVAFAIDLGGLVMVGGSPIDTYPAGIFIGSAAVVEIVAAVWGTSPRPRFTLLSGLGIGTIGMATEWAWNAGAHQPWTTALLPDAVLVGLVAALGAAVIGSAAGAALDRRPIDLPVPVLVIGGLLVAVALIIPYPRQGGEVHADVTVEQPDPEHAIVHVTLDPPDAADNARWFMVGSWQGGGKTTAHMERTGPGTYTADRPVPIDGQNKALLRLHRGAEMLAIPIRLPEDPSIGEPEIPAEDRAAAFVYEERYLQREVAAHDAGGQGFAWVVYGILALLAAAWVTSLGIAIGGLAKPPQQVATLSPRDDFARTG